jgi:glycosyltransferase involved in cell wall biosynthesis
LPRQAEVGHGSDGTPGGPTRPRVNVIITTYNHARYVRRAIEGVLAQEGVSFDLTIVDDVSTDGTGAIIQEFASAHPDRIQVSCPPVNLFSSAELRRAVNRCEAEFIALMDGDDYWIDPAKLRKQVAVLDEDPSLSMCFHDCVIVDEEGQLVGDSFYWLEPPRARTAYRYMGDKNYVPGPSPVIRRKAIWPLPSWIDSCEWSDWPLHLIAAEYGPIAYIPEPMAAYRVHPGGQWSAVSAEERFEVTRRFLAYFATHLPAARARELDRGIGWAWTIGLLGALRKRELVSAGRLVRALLTAGRGGRKLALISYGALSFCHVLKVGVRKKVLFRGLRRG